MNSRGVLCCSQRGTGILFSARCEPLATYVFFQNSIQSILKSPNELGNDMVTIPEVHDDAEEAKRSSGPDVMSGSTAVKVKREILTVRSSAAVAAASVCDRTTLKVFTAMYINH